MKRKAFILLIIKNFLILIPCGFIFLVKVQLPIHEYLKYLLLLVIGFTMVTINSFNYRKAVSGDD